MKTRILLFISILAGGIILTGCPYESDYPIDNPSIKIDIGWLGKWESADGTKNPDGTNPIYYVTKKTDNSYALKTTYSNYDEMGNFTEETNEYEGHVSIVNGIKFFNLIQINSDPSIKSSYMLFKLEISGSTVVLSEISSCINKKFSSSAELKTFLTNNLNNELLYSGSQTFFKQ